MWTESWKKSVYLSLMLIQSEVSSQSRFVPNFYRTYWITWSYVLLIPLYSVPMPSATTLYIPHRSLGSTPWCSISSGILPEGLLESIERNKAEKESDRHWSFEPYQVQSFHPWCIPTEFLSRAQHIVFHHSRHTVWDRNQIRPPGLRATPQDCRTVVRWLSRSLVQHRSLHWSKARMDSRVRNRRDFMAQVFPY